METIVVEPLVDLKNEVIEISDEEAQATPTESRPKKRRKRKPVDLPRMQCDKCDKFYSKHVLKRHMQVHTGDRPHMCTTCGKTYTQLSHLRTHQMQHLGLKNFHCLEDDCNASFYRKTELDLHTRIHTGEKPYTCEICSKSFVQKGNLMMHIKMHNGDRPHACPVCEKRFMTRSKLREHSKRHEKEKERKGKNKEVLIGHEVK